MTKIKRQCADCGSVIRITVHHDGTYEGKGHFFSLELPDGSEYWECDHCYES